MQRDIRRQERFHWIVSNLIIFINFNFYNHRLAEKLLEKETLSLPDIVDILGPRPFAHKKNLLDYLEELRGRLQEEDTSAPDDSIDAKVDATKFDEDAVESASDNEDEDDLDSKKKDDDKSSKNDKEKKDEWTNSV